MSMERDLNTFVGRLESWIREISEPPVEEFAGVYLIASRLLEYWCVPSL